jgi:hypothetical protein
MKRRWIERLLLCLALPWCMTHAQGADENLMREVGAVRLEIARSAAGLRHYTWTEQTEVSIGGSVKSESVYTCHYSDSGQILRTPAGTGKEKDMDPGRATSKRPRTRGKADTQDYIERAVSRIHNYVPPDPKQIDHLLDNGKATLGQSADGKPQVRFTYYFEEGDSLVFTYDPQTKRLLHATISSSLGDKKHPVALEVDFETLPDGVNHVSSAVLTAKKKNVEVKMRNLDYRKATQ